MLVFSWVIIGMIFSYLTWKLEKLHVKKFNEECLWFGIDRFSRDFNFKIMASDFTMLNLFIGALLGYVMVIGFIMSLIFFLIEYLKQFKIENRDE